MRRMQKEQALKIVELLEQAHKQIKIKMEQGDTGSICSLLQDCQDSAIAVGTMIEKSEGEGTKAVSLLEKYCELIYQLHESVVAEKRHEGLPFLPLLQECLNDIMNNILQDITVRKEVVFLPYKASMWDSLESVWRTAVEDPAVDAYVVPIPYYDKNPDGSFREVHYEGDEYPEDVPIVSYEEYDFEGRHPDEIYIHNPYDDCNYVTSVHPFFYSGNLKQFTDKLIYIPYFVLAETDPNDQEAVASISHFVTVPAVIHANQVIVQSENMRQIYIDVMTREAGEHTRKFWEKKIVGTGSPKFDKIIHTQITDEDIPEEWKKIIFRSDGRRKKVVLYNTSVSSLLQYSHGYIRKMKEVFDNFFECCEKVALLWRPHPLMQATISSMRPELWDEYQELVEEYQKQAWGIYDDTADLNRAIALCDAYYGDLSSVVQLCQKVKKPILIQNARGNIW